MAKKLICPHCNAEVEPGVMDCPFCHQSMFLSMSQIKAKEEANLNPNRVVTVDEYMAKQQQIQYQQQLNNNMNQPVQQPMMQPVQQQIPNQVPIQTLIDPKTGQTIQGYYDPYSGQWVTLQQTMKNQPKNQGQNQSVLYIALALEVLGFLIGGGFIFGIIALILANSYKDSNGLKSIIKIIAYINIAIGLVVLLLLFIYITK